MPSLQHSRQERLISGQPPVIQVCAGCAYDLRGQLVGAFPAVSGTAFFGAHPLGDGLVDTDSFFVSEYDPLGRWSRDGLGFRRPAGESRMPPNGNGTLAPALALIGQVGFVMVACILAGVLAGRYLDGILGTRPVLMLLLAVAGAGGGMAAVYRLIMKSAATQASDDHEESP